jgi:DNA-directed RNA polymerase specialized sigma24 family protein
MAKLKRSAPAEEAEERSAADKIAGLLAIIATKGMDSDAAALRLHAVGFSSREIADLLDVHPNYVNVARHRRKSGTKKKPRKSPA